MICFRVQKPASMKKLHNKIKLFFRVDNFFSQKHAFMEK